ncbi:MAG: nucleoid occlusion protein [Clostridiales bacterium]|jgi:ParB family chromosome partitioning protein|nr:nucleoid occlusion protein [Clostridiales bacterium]
MENPAFIGNREILDLPVDKINPSPYQPRKFFERGGLEELAGSIREYGVMQPISVRLINGHAYELVSGERRLRATRMAGLSTIPAIVVNISDQDSAILAIIENLQRQNLNFLEEAEGFQNLMQDYAFTQDQLAERIGKSQSTIANKLRILKLPKKIQKILLENDLTERHARALLKLDDEPLQKEILQQVIAGDLTVKKTEELVELALKRKSPKPEKTISKIRHYIKDIRIFTNTMRQALDMMDQAGVKNEYFMEETEGGYEIKIKLFYSAQS